MLEFYEQLREMVNLEIKGETQGCKETFKELNRELERLNIVFEKVEEDVEELTEIENINIKDYICSMKAEELNLLYKYFSKQQPNSHINNILEEFV